MNKPSGIVHTLYRATGYLNPHRATIMRAAGSLSPAGLDQLGATHAVPCQQQLAVKKENAR